MKIAAPLAYCGPLASPANLVSMAVRAETLGYDFVWMGEHIYYPKAMKGRYPYTVDGSLPITPRFDYFEILTSFAFLAARTSRLRFHTNILMPAIRSPFLAAKQIATLDSLSGGRVTVALGLGWMIDEYELVGTPWRERGKYLDEWIVAIRAFMAGAPFEGRYFRFEEGWFEPKPSMMPFPFWIGGDSDAAVRRAAQLGQGWEPVGPADIAEKCLWLHERLERITEMRADGPQQGAPFHVLTSCGYQGTGRGANAIRAAKSRLQDDIGHLAEAGVDHLIVRFNELNADDLEQVMDEAEWFAQDLLPWAQGL